MNSLVEKKLICGVKQGDYNSFKELHLIYRPLLLGFVCRYLKNEADSEEIVQDVFTRIWEQRQNLNEDLSFKSFLYTITKNKIMDYFRKTKMEVLHARYIENYLEIITNSPSKQLISKDISESIAKVIEQLPEKRKIVFLLSKKFGLSRSEIAQFLNISENTVKNQLQEAIQFLRKNLKNEVIQIFLIIGLYL